MSFLDSLDTAVGDATGVRGSIALTTMKGPLDAVANPITEAFASPPPGSPPAPFNPARTVQKVAGAAMAAINAPLEMMNTGFAVATNKIAAIFPALPAATLGSLYLAPPHGHLHPPSFTPPATPAPIPLPSLGPVMLGTSIKVLIAGMPAARAGDIGMAITCVGICPAFEIFMGSSKVFIGGMRAARMTDMAKACTPSIAGAVRGIAAGMAAAGQVIALSGVVADSIDAGGPDAAVAAASGVAAAMGAAQMAVDAATMAITAAMGVDMAVPPSFGMVTVGMPNVMIGGFPMINFPNPAHLLFDKIKAMRAKKKAAAAEAANAGCASCPA
ncbi:MAG: Rhs family protein [Fibrobacteres bacterium]|nr:Rhs family protein [Fibrobacterota bacterium]